MTTNEKGLEGTAIPETSPSEINQVHSKPGFETCQDIQTIKEELARLEIEMDKYNYLAVNEPDISKSAEHYRKVSRDAIRYWAIRWVMGWEKEIPQMKGERG